LNFRVSLSEINNQQSPNEDSLVPPALASDYEDFDVVKPQGTTKRPQQQSKPHEQPPLLSLSDLPSTTPRPSPFLVESLQTVPGSNQGN